LHIISKFSKEKYCDYLPEIFLNIKYNFGKFYPYVLYFRDFLRKFNFKYSDKNLIDFLNKIFDKKSGYGEVNFKDNDSLNLIKFIMESVPKEQIDDSVNNIIKDNLGEENYKIIFGVSKEASPEEIQRGYVGNSTRESRHYKF